LFQEIRAIATPDGLVVLDGGLLLSLDHTDDPLALDLSLKLTHSCMLVQREHVNGLNGIT